MPGLIGDVAPILVANLPRTNRAGSTGKEHHAAALQHPKHVGSELRIHIKQHGAGLDKLRYHVPAPKTPLMSPAAAIRQFRQFEKQVQMGQCQLLTYIQPRTVPSLRSASKPCQTRLETLRAKLSEREPQRSLRSPRFPFLPQLVFLPTRQDLTATNADTNLYPVCITYTCVISCFCRGIAKVR